jgi:hypothetical protein
MLIYHQCGKRELYMLDALHLRNPLPANRSPHQRSTVQLRTSFIHIFIRTKIPPGRTHYWSGAPPLRDMVHP